MSLYKRYFVLNNHKLIFPSSNPVGFVNKLFPRGSRKCGFTKWLGLIIMLVGLDVTSDRSISKNYWITVG